MALENQVQVPQSKNGICSAHPLLIEELKQINEKLDNLTNEDMKKKTLEELWEPWKNRILGSLFTIGVYVVFELIKYFTPL